MGWLVALLVAIALYQVNRGFGEGGDTLWEEAAKKAKKKREAKKSEDSKE